MTIKSDQHGFPVQAARPSVTQNVVYTTTTVQSAPFSVATSPAGSYSAGPVAGVPITTPNQTTHVRLVATTDCYVSFGDNPTAGVNTGFYLPALTPEYFWVVPGERLAVNRVSVGGTLNITECTM
jgi:hypothetical protein